jgi:hypothetical protein
MGIPSSYLTSQKNLKPIFESIQKAGVPRRFSYEFLKQLGFASSGDRPFVGVLKSLRFLDDGGAPTDRYRRFKDPGQAPAVMTEALRDAYADVFTIDVDAGKLSVNELKGLFARLSDKGDAVNEKMARTFKGLADLADFALPDAVAEPQRETPEDHQDSHADKDLSDHAPLSLHHDIHIHLPVSTEIAVYDAIFKSLRDNLS